MDFNERVGSASARGICIILASDLVQIWAITAPSQSLFPMTWHYQINPHKVRTLYRIAILRYK